MAKIRITQLKSGIGKTPRQRANLKSLGLRGIRHQVDQEKTPQVEGILKKIGHLVKVEDI